MPYISIVTPNPNGSNVLSTPGGNASEFFNGGSGDDLVLAGAGADLIYGNGGNDVLNGGDDNDILDGGTGNDLLNGDTGNDELYGGAGDDTLNGSDGSDTLSGGDGNDLLEGGTGDDSLVGGFGSDTLRGGDGDDVLDASIGENIMIGGPGVDLARFDIFSPLYMRIAYDMRTQIYAVDVYNTPTFSSILYHNTLQSVELLKTSDSTIALDSSLSGLFKVNDSLGAASTFGTAYVGPVVGLQRQYLGTNGNEVVTGTSGNDFINLLGGDDATDGGAGNDVIDGGLGSNFLTGGSGIDTFFLDARGNGATVTWSTITDWQAGEQLSVFGFRPGRDQIPVAAERWRAGIPRRDAAHGYRWQWRDRYLGDLGRQDGGRDSGWRAGERSPLVLLNRQHARCGRARGMAHAPYPCRRNRERQPGEIAQKDLPLQKGV